MGWIDAPVSGGTKGAEEGTLAVMAGGKAADYRKSTALRSGDGAKAHPYGPGRRRPDHKALQSGDRRLRHGCARGGDASRRQRRNRRQTAAGGACRRLCRFNSAAIIRAAHGPGNSFAAARPYRNDVEGSRHGRRCRSTIHRVRYRWRRWPLNCSDWPNQRAGRMPTLSKSTSFRRPRRTEAGSPRQAFSGSPGRSDRLASQPSTWHGSGVSLYQLSSLFTPSIGTLLLVSLTSLFSPWRRTRPSKNAGHSSHSRQAPTVTD